MGKHFSGQHVRSGGKEGRSIKLIQTRTITRPFHAYITFSISHLSISQVSYALEQKEQVNITDSSCQHQQRLPHHKTSPFTKNTAAAPPPTSSTSPKLQQTPASPCSSQTISNSSGRTETRGKASSLLSLGSLSIPICTIIACGCFGNLGPQRRTEWCVKPCSACRIALDIAVVGGRMWC